MEMRVFGRTGMRVSLLGFGCGAVGGLMVRGDPGEQERAIARALEAGVTYFDTAVQYGDGESEKNLGRVLGKLKPANAVVGTKSACRPASSAASGRPQADRSTAVCGGWAWSGWTSSICTMPSRMRAAASR